MLLLIANQAKANAIPERDFVRNNYPKFEEVFNRIMMRVRFFCDECYYGIAKKPGGYYLTATPFDKEKPTEFLLIWDRNNANFVDFDAGTFAGKQRLGDEPPAELKNNFQQSDSYDFYLYYGYNGWIEDTRALLNKYPVKTAQDLEILARTYANEATEAAHPGITDNYVDLSGLFEDKGYAKVGSAQQQYFEKAADQALVYWKELKRDYPDYETMNGDAVSLKLSNEYMHFYELAKSIKAVSLSSAYFRNIYFDEAWVQFARNLLDACEQDGILFTSGSSDTYPLVFAQKKLGIREDVTLVNASLLNASWYWDMLREDAQLSTSIKSKEFEALLEKPVFVDIDAPAAPFKQWLEKILDEKTEETYRLLPGEIFLSYQGTNMELALKTRSLFMSDLIVLDILTNNPEKKAFTSNPYGFVRMGLYYNLAPTGRSFALVPDRIAAMESLNAIENIEDLAFYSTQEYLSALGSIAEREFSMLSYLIINVSPVFQDRKDALVAKIYKQLPPKSVVELEDIQLLDAVNAFYEVMKPDACEELQTYFQPLAEDIILNASSMSKELENEIESLEHIFSIYAHYRVYDTPEFANPDFEIPDLTPMEISVLTQLKQKALVLFESPVVRQRSWIRNRLVRLLRALEILELE